MGLTPPPPFSHPRPARAVPIWGRSRLFLETAHRTLQNIGQVMRFAVATGRAESDPTVALRKTIAFPIGPWFQLGDPRLVLALFLGLIEFALSWREAARRPRAS